MKNPRAVFASKFKLLVPETSDLLKLVAEVDPPTGELGDEVVALLKYVLFLEHELENK